MDPAERGQLLRAIREHGSVNNHESLLRTRDGRIRMVRGNFHATEIGGRDVLLAAFVDITERREAERRIEESETRFRTAFMMGGDVNLILERDTGRIVAVNEQFEAVFGYRREDAIGRTTVELGLWAYPEARGQMLARLAAEGRVRDFEVVACRRNGERFPMLYAVTELGGTPPLLMGVARDLSEQRRTGEALRSLEEQFRQAQRLEAVGRLAGGIAHDFNNILTAITGYTELLLDAFGPEDPRGELVGEIRTASQRAAALTRQLLAFSRKQVLQPRVLDLNEVVRGLERMLRRLIGEDVELAFAAGSGLDPVQADPGQIEQVILNLAVNARDAMPSGGRLTIETANVELDRAYAADHAGATPGAHVMVAVSDTGVGMERETLAHLFEPFFTTKEPGKGTGLGLATVHGIVVQSGGHVAVYSEPGGGRPERAGAGTRRRGTAGPAADGHRHAGHDGPRAGPGARRRASRDPRAVHVRVYRRRGGAPRRPGPGYAVSSEAVYTGGPRPQGARGARPDVR